MSAAPTMQAIEQRHDERRRLLGCLAAFEQRLRQGSRNCWLCTAEGRRLMLLWSGYPVRWVRAHGTFYYAVDNLTGRGVVKLARSSKVEAGHYRVEFA